MFLVAKSFKGQEFFYNTRTAIACSSEKRANILAAYLNEHNDNACEEFRLKDTEVWCVHEYDQYDKQPWYVLKSMGKRGIKVAGLW